MKLYRKLATVLAAAAFVVSMAGSALAYFEENTLTRVVWNTTTSSTTEQHVDLGNIFTLTGVGYNATLATGDAGWDDLFSPGTTTKVVYFGQDIISGNFWVSAPQGSTLNIAISQLTNLQSKIDKIQSNDGRKYSTVDGTVAEALILKTDPNSYKSIMGTGGKMSSFNISVEATLTAAATQSLYFFDIVNNVFTGKEVATITTNLDGSTTIRSLAENPAVPIPAAAYLLGSGLLGLIGLRRRMND